MEEVTQTAATHDQETRDRLLEAATRLFGERGFDHVTVRDICSAAGANLAAVNYYFRDKSGLYQEVIQRIAGFINRMSETAHDAGPGKSPEERLRHYIRTFLRHLLSEGVECWHGRLMAREMADPTPALDIIFEQAIRPNSARVHKLVSEIMCCPGEDPRVGMCVGSIQTQMVGLANPIAMRFIPKFTPEVIDALAHHIAEFSLAGIRGIAEKKQEGTK